MSRYGDGLRAGIPAALEGVTTWAVPQDAPMGTQLTLSGAGPRLVFGKPAGG